MYIQLKDFHNFLQLCFFLKALPLTKNIWHSPKQLHS
jgi:hypothetical protein